MDKKLNVAMAVFDRKIREMKPFVFDEACKFIAKQTQAAPQLLTK